MKVVVAGGSGFIGNAIIKRLNADPSTKVINLTSRKSAQNAQAVYVDYQDESDLISLLERERPDVLVHLASCCIRDNSARGLERGLRRDKAMLKALRRWEVPLKVVFFSSMACFDISDQLVDGNEMAPSTFYGREKALMAGALSQLRENNPNISFHIIIPSSVYGLGQGGKMFLPSLLQHVRKGERMVAFGSKKRRDFVHVTDVSAFICRVILKKEWPIEQTIFLHSGNLYELGYVAKLACDVAGTNFSEAISFVDSDSDRFDCQRLLPGVLARSGFRPSISLESGIREMFGEA